MLSPPVIELASALAELLPPGLEKILLVNTGSESNEAALRMAKLRTGGFEVVGFTDAWHGMTAGSSAVLSTPGIKGTDPVCRVRCRCHPPIVIVVRFDIALTNVT